MKLKNEDSFQDPILILTAKQVHALAESEIALFKILATKELMPFFL